jgi:hypothetical protein
MLAMVDLLFRDTDERVVTSMVTPLSELAKPAAGA